MLRIFKRLLRKPFTPLNIITISKSRLISNYENLSKVNPKIKIAPVLKSNAYGHGIKLVGKILDQSGAPFLCVDSLYEAFQLRSIAKVQTPILIMGYIHPKSLSIKKLPFSFSIYNLEHAQVLNEYQKGSKVHIFVDTGMHREGISMEELPEFLEGLKKLKNIEVEGLMSHLAEPDKPDSELTKTQITNFLKAKKLYQEFSLTPIKSGLTTRGWKADIWFHLGGSYGLSNKLTVGCNLVRVGRALYGIDESPARNGTHSVAGGDTKTRNLKLSPILKHTSTIVQIKKIKKGDKVGYSGTFVAPKDMSIGVLPLGYNDGIDRRLSNRGVVGIPTSRRLRGASESGEGVEGRTIFCPIIGLVSMNITTIDLSSVKAPFLGQVAVVFSDNSKDPNSVVNASRRGGVLPHEMLIHIAESTKRVVI